MDSAGDASSFPLQGARDTPVIHVTNTGLINIGGREFRVKFRGEEVVSEKALQTIAKLLENGYGFTQITTALTAANHTGGALPLKMVLSSEGQLDVCTQAAKITTVAAQSRVKEKSGVQYIQGKVEKIQTGHNEAKKISKEFELYLQSGGFTRQEVRDAITELFSESHLSLARLVDPDGDISSEDIALGFFDRDKTLGAILHEPGNEALRAALLRLKETYQDPDPASRPKKVNPGACDAALRLFVMQKMQRNPKEIVHASGAVLRQSFVQGIPGCTPQLNTTDATTLQPKTLRKENHAFSSAQDKGTTRILGCNSNLGAVRVTDNDGDSHVVVTRSARSDTPERLREAVIEAAINHAQTTDMTAFQNTGGLDDGRPVYIFRHQISSHCDLSSLKSIAGKENERQAMLDTVAGLKEWPPEGYKIVLTNAEGEDIVVVLQKPIVRNQIFSYFVGGLQKGGISTEKGTGQKESFRLNFVPNQQLFQLYLQKRDVAETSPIDPLKSATVQLDKRLQRTLGVETSCIDPTTGFINFDKIDNRTLFEKKDFFKSQEFQEYQQCICMILLHQIIQGDTEAYALYSVLFNRELPEGATLEGRAAKALADPETYSTRPSVDEQMHAADVELCLNYFCDQMGISCGKQCKSGKDRTAISVALKTAQELYFQETNEIFLPGLSNEREYDLFRKCFKEALHSFGLAVTVESGGQFGLKIGEKGFENPVPYKYLTDTEVERGQESVRSERYPESPKDPIGIYGKANFAKHVEKARQVLRNEKKGSVNAAKNDLERFLIDELQIPGLKHDHIFSPELELLVHIHILHLGENQRFETLQSEVERLKSILRNRQSQKPEEDACKLYALMAIEKLYMQRQQAKTALKPESAVKRDISSVATQVFTPQFELYEAPQVSWGSHRIVHISDRQLPPEAYPSPYVPNNQKPPPAEPHRPSPFPQAPPFQQASSSAPPSKQTAASTPAMPAPPPLAVVVPTQSLTASQGDASAAPQPFNLSSIDDRSQTTLKGQNERPSAKKGDSATSRVGNLWRSVILGPIGA